MAPGQARRGSTRQRGGYLLSQPVLLDTADEVARWFRVQPKTVRMWARRGYITRHPGDRYSMLEVADWWDQRRDTRMAAVRQAGASGQRRVTMTPRDASPQEG